MSYILEALKKADQDRDLGAVPSLATPHEVERPPRRSFRWLWVVAALLSVNVVLLVLLLKGGDSQEPVMAGAAPERRPTLTGDQPAQPVQETGEVRVDEAPAPERTAPETGEALPAGESVALPEPANSRNPEPLPRPEKAAGGRADPVIGARDVSQLQSWYELPAELRSRLTLPRLDMHVYSEEPRNRFILVDLQKYREGETLESGLVLEEILPDGMVMSYRGERFLVDK